MTLELDLYESVPLNNGLVLNLYNGSKQIAEKLWYVSLTGRVEIPVEASVTGHSGPSSLDMEALKSALGSEIFFEKKMERNFIFEEQKASVLQLLRDYFMDSIVRYLSHADFARRYVLKSYGDFIKKNKMIHSQIR